MGLDLANGETATKLLLDGLVALRGGFVGVSLGQNEQHVTLPCCQLAFLQAQLLQLSGDVDLFERTAKLKHQVGEAVFSSIALLEELDKHFDLLIRELSRFFGPEAGKAHLHGTLRQVIHH